MWLMSAWPRHYSLHSRHCTDTTRLHGNSDGHGYVWPEIHWWRSRITFLDGERSYIGIYYIKCVPGMCVTEHLAPVHVLFEVFGFFCFVLFCMVLFPRLVKQKPPMFFQMGTSHLHFYGQISLFFFSFFSPLLTPPRQACGAGVTGLNGRLWGSELFFMQVWLSTCADCGVCTSALFTAHIIYCVLAARQEARMDGWMDRMVSSIHYLRSFRWHMSYIYISAQTKRQSRLRTSHFWLTHSFYFSLASSYTLIPWYTLSKWPIYLTRLELGFSTQKPQKPLRNNNDAKLISQSFKVVCLCRSLSVLCYN